MEGKKSIKNYDGQVLHNHIEDESIEISCLRKQDNEGMIFKFPDREDKCWIESEQILQKLENLKIVTDGSGTRSLVA